MFANNNSIKILSVTKLNRFAKRVLETEIGLVWVSGEISNFVAAASGHWYFTLKDEKAQVKSAMFRGANQKVGFMPKQGDKVLVRANLSIYEPRGDYQLIVQQMEPEGIGILKQQFEQLKHKLFSEGLFDEETKSPMPTSITTIGVITSPTGAAIHDVLTVLERRNRAIEVILYPTAVQGEKAAAEIVSQIITANRRKEVDVLIVGRGGGSLEDLWPFNEEVVARAIFESDLPIVSAVGHEVDVTISDFVADVRAPTPSAAAELLSADSSALLSSIIGIKKRLELAFYNRYKQMNAVADINERRLHSSDPKLLIQRYSQSLDNLLLRMRANHPTAKLDSQRSYLTQLTNNLKTSMKAELKNREEKLGQSKTQVLSYSPKDDIQKASAHVSSLSVTLLNSMTLNLSKSTGQLSTLAGVLDSVSPLATLKRGYSISKNKGGIVKSVEQVATNEVITTKVADGEITSRIEKISAEKE